MSRKPKKKQEGVKNEWMTSYADMVTVLFALFVMLYALSEVDELLWQEFALAAAIGAGSIEPFDFAGDGVNELLGNGVMDLPLFDFAIFEFIPGQHGHGQGGQHQMEIVADALQTYFGVSGFGDHIYVEFDGEGQLLISTHGDMYFDTGQAWIRQETFPVLNVIASAINNLTGVRVSVEGHTDNVPIATARFPDNLELSVARAASISRFLIEQGVDPVIIRATGFGEYHPVMTNATPEGRQANRRVEIRIYEANNSN
ncbi:MAG: flagellar motor protein MotB [Clostridiales bacterium]|jgi:chemotaxis protein MotB|nr:flagellar motor protein MotB [Clostridiales bacterium]